MAVSQEDIVRKVQALWRKVDDPASTDAEKKAAADKARELMARHAIDEIVLQEQSNGKEAIVMADILLYEEGDEDDTLVPDQRMTLAFLIARNTRCKAIITDKEAGIYEDGSAQVGGCYMLVYGYKSDVAMVELLYTALMSDMIVAFYKTDLRHVKKQAQRTNIMVNFCVGYVRTIRYRLEEINKTVHDIAESDGSLLPVLRSREMAVQDAFDSLYPPEQRTSVEVKGYTVDPNAQLAGAAAADKADLGGTAVSGRKEALEA